MLLKVNMKKIELLQSVKVLALNIQRHLKLREAKLKEKENKTKNKNREPGLLPPTVALSHQVFTNSPVARATPHYLQAFFCIMVFVTKV